MVNRVMSGVRGANGLVLTFAALLVAGASTGCLGGECSEGEYLCTATGIDRCHREPEMGATSQWQTEETCANGTQCIQDVFVCGYGPTPDPRCPQAPVDCHGDSAFCGSYHPACDGTTVLSCEGGYLTAQRTCGAGATCFLRDEHNAMGVLSTTPEPRCGTDSESSYCDGDQIVDCAYGYAVARALCGTADWPPSAADPGRTRCVETSVGAVCVPPSAYPSQTCTQDAFPSGFMCDGTLLIECDSGYAVQSALCRSCSVQKDTGYTWTVDCTGRMGFDCTTETDCAQGYACSYGKCNAPCTTSDQCATASSGSSLLPAFPARCFASWCELHW
jgi:hypothetical protein